MEIRPQLVRVGSLFYRVGLGVQTILSGLVAKTLPDEPSHQPSAKL